MCGIPQVESQTLAFFPNAKNWHVARGILFAIIRAQRRHFPLGFKDYITRKCCGKLKLKDKGLFYDCL